MPFQLASPWHKQHVVKLSLGKRKSRKKSSSCNVSLNFCFVGVYLESTLKGRREEEAIYVFRKEGICVGWVEIIEWHLFQILVLPFTD